MASTVPSESDSLSWKIPLAKLNSAVNQEVAEAKEEIYQSLLSNSREINAILGDLFNLYVSTNCTAASEILLEQSQQHHVNFLFEKMNENLKNSERKYPTLMLLWSVIQRQPSWIHTIISTAFFNSFIKCLKMDNDVVILITGILILTSLLPSVPSLVGSFLVDFYEIFERVFLFTARKRGSIPDTHLLHLQVGVQVFFHRLYAMYPNNTVVFMKSFYESHHDKEVDRSVESLLRWVKFHPWLMTETEQTEVSNTRWRSKEPHDVIIDCEKVSLDPGDCHIQESEVLSLVCPSRQSFSDGTTLESSGVLTSSDNSVQQTSHDDDRLDIATQTGTSLQNQQPTEGSFDSGTDMRNSTPLVASSAMFCSPTTLCSLNSPPPSQDTSPAGSTLDVSLLNNSSTIEMNELRTTPTVPEHSPRKHNMNTHHTSRGLTTPEALEDKTPCGRNTPPIDINSKNHPKHKETCSGNCGLERKQKEAIGLDLSFVTEDSSDDKDSEIKSIGSGEKDAKHKAKLPGETLDMFLPFTTGVCRHCVDDRSAGVNRAKGDWESQVSPAQLLDQYLQFGKSLQGRRLNRIPLTSQEGTQWTHFGGCAPADEVTLLRSELLLLQSEVLFERHKCDLHATRNRRLVGKVFQTNTVKEELLAIKDQMRLLALEMDSVTQSLKEKLAENRTLKEKAGSWNSQQQEMISDLSRTNESLALEKQELDEKLKQYRSENEKLQAELKTAKSRIYQLENDMAHLKSLENENVFLKSQSDMQAKNLLIMGEREEQLKDLIHVLRTTVKKSPEDQTKLRVYQQELEGARALATEQKVDLACLRTHVSDLESALGQKENQIIDLKKSIENIKKVWMDKLEGVESKYQSIKRGNQRLESEVMSLYSKLDARSRDR